MFPINRQGGNALAEFIEELRKSGLAVLTVQGQGGTEFRVEWLRAHATEENIEKQGRDIDHLANQIDFLAQRVEQVRKDIEINEQRQDASLITLAQQTAQGNQAVAEA